MIIPWSHRLGPWCGHWRPMSKKWQKKNPVCETAVWSLTLKKPGPGDRGTIIGRPGEKPECRVRRPSKLPVIDGGRTPALKLLPSGSPQIRWRRMERGRIQLFNIWRRRQEKKGKFAPFRSPPSYLRQPESNNFKTGVRGPSIREVLMDDRRPRSGFWPGH